MILGKYLRRFTMSNSQKDAQIALLPDPQFSQSQAQAPFPGLSAGSELLPSPGLQGSSASLYAWNYSPWRSSPVPVETS